MGLLCTNLVKIFSDICWVNGFQFLKAIFLSDNKNYLAHSPVKSPDEVKQSHLITRVR